MMHQPDVQYPSINTSAPHLQSYVDKPTRFVITCQYGLTYESIRLAIHSNTQTKALSVGTARSNTPHRKTYGRACNKPIDTYRIDALSDAF